MLFDKSMSRISLLIGIDSENKGGWVLLRSRKVGLREGPKCPFCRFNKNRVQSRV